MSTLMLGLLMALPLLQAFKLKSWVVSATVCFLLVSVALGEIVNFHTIQTVVSIITLLTTTVLLNQRYLRFSDLLALNGLLFLHVIAAYISGTSAVIMLMCFVLFYLLTAMYRHKHYLDWLFIFCLSLWWLLFKTNLYWLFVTLFFSIHLLRNQSKT